MNAPQPSPWSVAAEDWAVIQEPQHRPLWMAMQLAAGVQKGTRLLDAGCGAGGACFLAAYNYGAEVWGFDGAEPLIQLARQRVPSAHFAVGDLGSPPFAGEQFHVIHAANSLQFAKDPALALAAWKERLLPHGCIVVGLWSPQDENEQIHIMRAVRTALPEPPPGGNPFALSQRGMMEDLMRAAGLSGIESRDVPNTFEYPDLETCWRGLRSGGSLRGAIDMLGEARIKEVFMAAAQRFLMSDGSVFIHNKMRYVLGRNS